MKKYIKPLLIIAVVLTFVFGIKIFDNHLNGSFISNYIADNGITEITIAKEKANGELIQEVTLDENQVQELNSLFNSTTFIRRFSSTTQYEDKTTYRITGRTADHKERLLILAQGQESMFVAVSLSNTVGQQLPQTLLIEHGNWNTVIERILAT